MNHELVADVVLEGGGAKGTGLAGALLALHDKGYRLGDPGRVAGTSVGAIIGSLVAAGMPIPRIANLVWELDYRRFRDRGMLGPLSGGISLLTRLSLYRGDALHRWVAEQLESCGLRTFGDLRLHDPKSSLPSEHAYKLVVVVSDLTSGHMVRLPWDYAHYGLDPDEQLVADAVRASASIPYFFRPVQVKLPGDGQVAIRTDSGMLSGLPINLFDRTDGARPRWPTFGVKLWRRPLTTAWQADWAQVGGPIRLANAFLDTTVNAHGRLLLDDPAVCARTIFVDTVSIGATDFDLSPGQQQELFDNGRRAAERFLADWDFAEYLARYRR